ncbi:UNVERIFIED_CONTAM: hypothetical protein Slati_1733800 [Sesamum latifolium]|uniref:Uncharacterized protein n=1 Tax=Sesamum latifolium TaxID=2727402 RepID=A0AAW2WVJ1_9LAMI
MIGDEVATTHHITLSEEEDAEIAVPEFEEGVKTNVDELKEINLGDIENPRSIYISVLLTEDEEKAYVDLLHEFKDVFAWLYKEMLDLEPKVAVHQLSIRKGARPVKQAQHRFRPKLVPLIKVLLRLDSFKRDMNSACPKDGFTLPIAKLMIDATTGHEALSFMDGSFGYN